MTESIIMKPGIAHLKFELHLQMEECLRMRLYNTCRGLIWDFPTPSLFRNLQCILGGVLFNMQPFYYKKPQLVNVKFKV